LLLDLTWFLLVILTLGGALLGEFSGGGFWVTLVVAVATAVKGRLVIDRFMELGEASAVIRRVVWGFGLLVPLLILVVYLWGPELARLNWLGS
jgi:hypothetical protein